MDPVNEYNNIAWCGKFHQLNGIGTFLSFATSGLLTLISFAANVATAGMTGLCQPLHSQFLVSEIQSRHAVATFTGSITLPPRDEQLKDVEEKREAMRVQFKDSPRHTMMCNVRSSLDESRMTLSHIRAADILLVLLANAIVAHRYKFSTSWARI